MARLSAAPAGRGAGAARHRRRACTGPAPFCPLLTYAVFDVCPGQTCYQDVQRCVVSLVCQHTAATAQAPDGSASVWGRAPAQKNGGGPRGHAPEGDAPYEVAGGRAWEEGAAGAQWAGHRRHFDRPLDQRPECQEDPLGPPGRGGGLHTRGLSECGTSRRAEEACGAHARGAHARCQAHACPALQPATWAGRARQRRRAKSHASCGYQVAWCQPRAPCPRRLPRCSSTNTGGTAARLGCAAGGC